MVFWREAVASLRLILSDGLVRVERFLRGGVISITPFPGTKDAWKSLFETAPKKDVETLSTGIVFLIRGSCTGTVIGNEMFFSASFFYVFFTFELGSQIGGSGGFAFGGIWYGWRILRALGYSCYNWYMLLVKECEGIEMRRRVIREKDQNSRRDLYSIRYSRNCENIWKLL